MSGMKGATLRLNGKEMSMLACLVAGGIVGLTQVRVGEIDFDVPNQEVDEGLLTLSRLFMKAVPDEGQRAVFLDNAEERRMWVEELQRAHVSQGAEADEARQ